MNHLPLITGIIAITFLIFVLALTAGNRRPALPLRSRPVLSRAEIAFHRLLVAVTGKIRPDLMVLSQVSMCAFIDTKPGLDEQTRRAVRNKFNRKLVDFVLVDATTNVVLIVELDDSTHRTDNDANRDAITAAAGLKTLRMRGREARDVGAIERKLADAIG